MTTSSSQQAKQLLTEQIDILTDLNELLRLEYDIMNTQNTDEVQKLGDKKQNYVNDLEALNQTWQDFLRSQKAEFTLDGIRNAILKLEKAEKQGLPVLWEKLGDLSQACQKQNTINGAVVILRQQVTQQALDILRGQTMGGNSTYDNKGEQKSSGGNVGQPIAKA